MDGRQTMRIPLTQGKVALVDEQDYARVAKYKWRVKKGGGGRPYAARVVRMPNGKRRLILLHRFIMHPPAGVQIDHVNGDGLDNRRCNLRYANGSQNQANRHDLATNTSGFRGVTFHRQRGKWQAQIKVDGKNHYLGLFTSPEAAAAAYDEKAGEYFGEYARLNFGERRVAA